MSIRRFFTNPLIVRRLRSVAGNKMALQATATVDGHIRTLNREARIALGISEEVVYVGYIEEDADIQEGDKVTDVEGRVFKVLEVISKKYSFGINQHKEILLVEYND